MVSEEQNQSQQVPNKERLSKGAHEQTFGSYTSYWPFALAVALCILLMGLITNPIVLGAGIVLTAGAVIAWGLEQR